MAAKRTKAKKTKPVIVVNPPVVVNNPVVNPALIPSGSTIDWPVHNPDDPAVIAIILAAEEKADAIRATEELDKEVQNTGSGKILYISSKEEPAIFDVPVGPGEIIRGVRLENKRLAWHVPKNLEERFKRHSMVGNRIVKAKPKE